VTIPVKKSQETRYNPDLASFFHEPLLGQATGCGCINEALQIVQILEFERSIDRDEGFLEVKEAEGNEQHKSIISALSLAEQLLQRVFEWANFVNGQPWI